MDFNPFRVIPPLEIPPPAHSLRGQRVPTGSREALNGVNNFYKFFNAFIISHPPKRASYPLGGEFAPVGNGPIG